MERDPLLAARQALAARGVDDAEVAAVDARVEAGVTAAIEAARAAPDAHPATALTDVWADGGAAWRN
jgi:pyruvate dehydrogenase E1 component alpha subunit